MNVLEWNLSGGQFWLRILGRGFYVKDTRRMPLWFGERYGYTKGIRVGPYYASFLRRPSEQTRQALKALDEET